MSWWEWVIVVGVVWLVVSLIVGIAFGHMTHDPFDR